MAFWYHSLEKVLVKDKIRLYTIYKHAKRGYMKTKKTIKYVPVVAKVSSETRDYIKQSAEDSSRTISQQIRFALNAAIDKGII